MGVNSDLVVGVHSSSHHSTSKMEGHNRVWLTGLEELGRIATVVTLDYGAATRPAAWLHNGHVSMPPVSEPVVSVIHEACTAAHDLSRSSAANIAVIHNAHSFNDVVGC